MDPGNLNKPRKGGQFCYLVFPKSGKQWRTVSIEAYHIDTLDLNMVWTN